MNTTKTSSTLQRVFCVASKTEVPEDIIHKTQLHAFKKVKVASNSTPKTRPRPALQVRAAMFTSTSTSRRHTESLPHNCGAMEQLRVWRRELRSVQPAAGRRLESALMSATRMCKTGVSRDKTGALKANRTRISRRRFPLTNSQIEQSGPGML